MAEPWPAPTPLPGVKSRTRPIFKASVGEASLRDGCIGHFANILLTLESRVLAVGEGGSAVVQMLLRKRPPVSGEILHVAGLLMVHLGPHLAGPAASRDLHLAAIAAALHDVKPQIVVLDEALAEGSESWIQAFDEVLHGEAIGDFRGTVVVCVAAEKPGLPCHGCTERWVEVPGPASSLRQEEVLRSKLEFIDNAMAVAASGGAASRREAREAAKADADANALMEEVRELSEHCFDEDIDEVAHAEKLTLTLLVENMSDGSKSLRGYLCQKSFPPPRAELHISRLAVPRKHRGHGYAGMLMRQALGRAARAPRAHFTCITVSSLETAVPFYARLGFKVVEACASPKDGGDPQTWMCLGNTSIIPEPSASQVNQHLPLCPISSTFEPPQRLQESPGAASGSKGPAGKADAVSQQSRSRKKMKDQIQNIESALKERKEKKACLDEEDMRDLMHELEKLKLPPAPEVASAMTAPTSASNPNCPGDDEDTEEDTTEVNRRRVAKSIKDVANKLVDHRQNACLCDAEVCTLMNQLEALKAELAVK